MIAWLGPAAGPANYEVGEEVRAAFTDGDAGAAGAFVPTRPGHWHVDLYALARRRLAMLGVRRVAGGGKDCESRVCSIEQRRAAPGATARGGLFWKRRSSPFSDVTGKAPDPV